MIRSQKRNLKTASKAAASLPAGIKVVQPPKSAARRHLLSGPDIQTSGGARSAHSRSPKDR